MSNDIKTQGLSGRAIDIQRDAIKRAEEKVEEVFANENLKYNKNGIIDSKAEEAYFDIEIKYSNILTKKEKAIILGEKEAKAETVAKQKRNEKTDNKANELQFKSLLGALANNVEDVTLSNVKSKLEEEIFGQLNAKIATEKANLETAKEADKAGIQERIDRLTQRKEELVAEYKPLFDALDSVMDDMPEYKSYDAIKTSSVELSEKNSLNRAILSNLNQIAKNEMVQDALKEIKAEFLKEAKKESTTYKTNQEVLETIKANLKNTKDYEIALKLFEKDYLHNDSKLTIAQVASKISAEDGINEKSDFKAGKLHKKTKQTLKDGGVWDKYMRKADNKDNYGMDISENLVDNKKVLANLTKTEDEILEVFSGDRAEQKAKLNYLLLAQTELRDEKGQKIVDGNGKPVMFNLIEEIRDNDGNVVAYDMTNLSKLIGQTVGPDNTLNIHNRNNAELRVLAPKVNGDMMGLNLTDKEIKDLVKLSGRNIDRDNYDIIEGLKGTALGAFFGGALAGSTALGSYIRIAEEFRDINVEVNYSDKLNVDTLIEQMGKYNVNINIETNGKISILLKDLLANKKAFLAIAPLLTIDKALQGALIGGALGLLNGLKESEEIPTVDPALIDFSTLESFNNALESDKKLEKFAPLYTSLAVAYGFVNPDGTLKQDEFRDFIIFKVGGNTIINKEELKNMLMASYGDRELTRGAKAILEEKPTPIQTVPVETTPVEEETPVDPVDPVEVTPEIQASIIVAEKTEKPLEHTWTDEHNWQVIIATYYPEAKGATYKELKAAVDAFRDAHGISRQSAIPVGRSTKLVPITVNGKTYEPQIATEEDLANAIKDYGWQGTKVQWADVTGGNLKIKVTEKVVNGKKTYVATYKEGSNLPVTSQPMNSEEAAIKAVTPKAKSDADLKISVTVVDGNGKQTQKDDIIIKKK